MEVASYPIGVLSVPDPFWRPPCSGPKKLPLETYHQTTIPLSPLHTHFAALAKCTADSALRQTHGTSENRKSWRPSSPACKCLAPLPSPNARRCPQSKAPYACLFQRIAAICLVTSLPDMHVAVLLVAGVSLIQKSLILPPEAAIPFLTFSLPDAKDWLAARTRATSSRVKAAHRRLRLHTRPLPHPSNLPMHSPCLHRQQCLLPCPSKARVLHRMRPCLLDHADRLSSSARSIPT